VAVGRVLRFDQVRGFGFVVPDSGGEDVFLHANDLLDEKRWIVPGAIVEFDVEVGERGLKASSVTLKESPLAGRSDGVGASTDASRVTDDAADVLCDVLSAAELRQEVTDFLLAVDPTLTGKQILVVREGFTKIAGSHGWVEN
jgi:cold shock CspA family protein